MNLHMNLKTTAIYDQNIVLSNAILSFSKNIAYMKIRSKRSCKFLNLR